MVGRISRRKVGTFILHLWSWGQKSMAVFYFCASLQESLLIT